MGDLLLVQNAQVCLGNIVSWEGVWTEHLCAIINGEEQAWFTQVRSLSSGEAPYQGSVLSAVAEEKSKSSFLPAPRKSPSCQPPAANH